MSFTNISLKTVNELDKIIYTHKRKILEDIYKKFIESCDLENNEKITMQEFIDEFLENKTKKRIIKRKPKTVNLSEEERCNAKIWHIRDMEYMRCKFKKLEDCSYCSRHNESRNYGDWDNI